MIKLTQENYFSREASLEYMSSSQYKSFVGTIGRRGCEAKALAEFNGEWKDPESIPMMVGSYVDAHFEGTLDIFKAQNPGIFSKNGDLKAPYKKAEEIIQRIERDPFFMYVMSGEKQRIFTGEMFGVKWKCKIDSYMPGYAIVDLKVMKSLTETFWVKDYGDRVTVPIYWGHDLQGAIYQEIIFQNEGKRLPFYIAGASKETDIDIEVLGFTQTNLSDCLSLVQPNIQRIIDLKNGKGVPDKCGTCGYCRHTKILTEPIHYSLMQQKV